MKRTLIIGVALAFASGAAFAGHCPSDVAAIDKAMASSKLSDKDKAEVKKLRDEGDAAHKAGDHAKAITALHKAMDKMGLKHQDKK